MLLLLGILASLPLSAADSFVLQVRETQLEIKMMDRLLLKSMHSGTAVANFCERKLGAGWSHAVYQIAKAAKSDPKDVSTYFGTQEMLSAMDKILDAGLTGSRGDNIYIFQARTSQGYSYGWHYARQSDPPHLAELYVGLSEESFGGSVDAFCARVVQP